MAGEALELEVALGGQRVAGQELRQLVDLAGAERNVDEREAREHLLLDRLRPAAADSDDPLGSSRLSRLASPRWATKRLSAASRIEQVLNRIRSALVAARGLGVAERLEHALDPLGVVLVHLAAERRHVVAFRTMRSHRAIGIVRVSQTRGREGDSFHSPDQQRERIEQACARERLKLIDTFEELDVSGGKPLDKRLKLRQAVEAVEDGRADVIVVAYFDRLVRSMRIQAEVVERVESAGGRVLAVDSGYITDAGEGWLDGAMLGLIAEHQRRSTRLRLRDTQERAVARGATPWARIPLGYTRANGTLTPDPSAVPIVQRVYAMRLEGASLNEIREMLKSHGITRSQRGVQEMLSSRVYLGEVRFGKFENPDAHAAIIDPEVWNRVQALFVPRGPRPRSNRLLSRAGVLRCGSCGAALVAMKFPNGRNPEYPIYRCPSNSDCPGHVTISAEIVERHVVGETKRLLSNLKGVAAAAGSIAEARAALDAAQKALDASIRALTAAGVLEEPAAVDEVKRLREARDTAEDAYRAELDADSSRRVIVTASDDWDAMTLDAQRDLICAAISRVVVGKGGRGVERIQIEPRA